MDPGNTSSHEGQKMPTPDEEKCKRATVLLARVDSDKYVAQGEVAANIALEATSRQIKTLFRLKDDVEGLCAGEFPVSINFGHVALLATEFYNLRHPQINEGWKTFLPEEDLPADEEKHMADIRPIKINMILSAGTLAELKNNLKAIFSKLQQHHSDVNIYWVLNEVFRFALANEAEFVMFTQPKVTLNRPKKGVRIECEVCGDSCRAVEYCGVFACGKCRLFFQSLMREKTIFSLRCAKSNECDLRRDISCRKCRADKCRSLGMLDNYFSTEVQHPLSKTCFVCTARESDDDDTYKLVRGHLLCVKCEGFFDQTVEMNQKEHKPGQGLAFRNLYECKATEAACLITNDFNNCKSCLWDKMVRLGLTCTYIAKFQGFKPFSPSFGEDCVCAVCDKDASETLWMCQAVCYGCRSFLELSMRLESYLSYCCPYGENNRLCPINTPIREDDTSEITFAPVVTRCKFCWFRRLELEGLVERWMICGGRTELWNRPDDDEEVEENISDIDDEISFKQPDGIKESIRT